MAAITLGELKKLAPYPIANRLGFAFVVVWGLYLLPFEIFETLGRLSHLKDIVLSPFDSLSELLHNEFPHSAIASLSPSHLGLIYLGILFTGFGWYVWGTTRFYQTQRQRLNGAIAKYVETNFPSGTESDVGNISSGESKAGSVAGAATAAAGVASAATVGVSALSGAAGLGGAVLGFAPPLAASGPPGWLILAVAVTAAVIVGGIVAISNNDTQKAAATPNKVGVDAEIEARRMLEKATLDGEIKDIWRQFDERESKDVQRMFLTGLFILAIVIYNYVAVPFLKYLGLY